MNLGFDEKIISYAWNLGRTSPICSNMSIRTVKYFWNLDES